MAGQSQAAENGAGVARLAVSQARRMRRIVEAAVRLADEGGFEAVRLRDVADAADVALGTLYKYFPSKEDLLLFMVLEEVERLERVVAERPLRGESAVERITSLFARATRGMVERPEFSRAALRAIAAGGRGSELKVAAFHMRMTRLTVAALRGERSDPEQPLSARVGSERERQIALVLSQVWYAALLGWVSGLHGARTVTDRMRDTARLLLSDDD